MRKELSEYRPVTDSEIQLLLSNNCISDNWSAIEIKPGTNLHKCRNSRFSGEIKLGLFDNSFTDESGIQIHSGIVNAHIHNCLVGDNVTVYNIRDYIANYRIEENVVIRNCGRIHVEGLSSFGNGTSVAVLNETGTRAVKIWDKLSSQLAYILALYRHRPDVISKLEELINEYTRSVKSGTGTIGINSSISDCDSIINVRIGPFSEIEGAIKLWEGSVNSCMEDPVRIGHGVIMDNFIVCSGSEIDDSTIVDKCFIGQGCRLGKHYSAENSLFFANSGGYHGEACSVFAGPYTITHHKSTLLIAGLFSFLNAGSGSNQSNHMYKLGPVHQGIVERGSKTASDSYIQWPAHIGPFTFIKGRHYNNIDSSLFPFSYIIENKDESILVPGINLRNAGTIRDAQKWPLRDVRKDPEKADKIDFEILSPYTVSKMIRGREILKKLLDEAPADEAFSYKGMRINRSSLDRGIDLYQAGIVKYLGNALIKRLGKTQFIDIKDLRASLKFDRSHGPGEWSDLSGMIVPRTEVDILLDKIVTGSLKSLKEISDYICKVHNTCGELEWNWTAASLEEEENKQLAEFTHTDFIRIIERWKKSILDLDNMIIEDAKKEFSISSMTGFGMDGNDEDKQLDFEQVRGTFESNPFVRSIIEHAKAESASGDELIERIKKIK